MKPVSDLHAAARRWAEAGVPVFPCAPGSKVPATDHGFHDATTDLNVIDGWWTDEPRLNLAISPHTAGLAVVDIDGDEGEASWKKWQDENGHLPETYTIRTPRGGRHLYYRGILPGTQSKLGVHVDTRGVGSYALLPPSRVGDGRYVLEDRRTPADLPGAVGEFLERLKRDKAKASTADMDQPANVARAERLLRDYIARGRVAIEGHMGDATTFITACEVLNLGLSPEKAHELLCDIWNPECQPPWDEDELLTKVENASRYAQNDAGAWATGDLADTFKAALDKLGLEPEDRPSPAPRRRFKPWTLAEFRKRPPPSWLIPEMLPANALTMVYGQEKSFKSFIVAQHMAMPLAQLGVPVAYVAGEGASGLAQRIFAWQTVHDCPDDVPLYLIDRAPWANEPDMVDEFIKEMIALGPQLIVIDTLARAAVGLNENDAKDMGLFVAFLDTLREAVGCAVVVVHHSGKDASRGPRGSGALVAAIDASLEVKADKRVRAVSMRVTNMKDAPEREEPFCFEGQDVAGQLVFKPISHGEFLGLTKVNDTLAPKAIGALLRRIGAVGEENGVTNDVLAFEVLHEANPELSDETREGMLPRQRRVLAKLAQGRLEAYCIGAGSALRWFVP